MSYTKLKNKFLQELNLFLEQRTFLNEQFQSWTHSRNREQFSKWSPQAERIKFAEQNLIFGAGDILEKAFPECSMFL